MNIDEIMEYIISHRLKAKKIRRNRKSGRERLMNPRKT